MEGFSHQPAREQTYSSLNAVAYTKSSIKIRNSLPMWAELFMEIKKHVLRIFFNRINGKKYGS